MRINAFVAQLIVMLEVVLFFKNYTGNVCYNSGEFRDIESPLYATLLMSLFVGSFAFCLCKVVYSDLYRLWKSLVNKSKSD
jgi:ABC-type polysaccharide/polyol phosphate export permease